VLIACVFALSRGGGALFPIAVVLQVTPVVAIAPLILIYVDSTTAAAAVRLDRAFFPILSNTVIGLRCADANLRDCSASTAPRRGSGCACCSCPAPCPTSSPG
jgi:NitT/TauT family transport system permease protein